MTRVQSPHKLTRERNGTSLSATRTKKKKTTRRRTKSKETRQKRRRRTRRTKKKKRILAPPPCWKTSEYKKTGNPTTIPMETREELILMRIADTIRRTGDDWDRYFRTRNMKTTLNGKWKWVSRTSLLVLVVAIHLGLLIPIAIIRSKKLL